MDKELKDGISRITNEEIQKFLRNEEKLWDLAAITAAPTFYQAQLESASKHGFATTLHALETNAAKQAYDLADALMEERRRRFSREKKNA